MKKYLIGALITLGIIFGVAAYSTSGNVHSIVYDAASKIFNINIRGSETLKVSSGERKYHRFSVGNATPSGDGVYVGRAESYFDLEPGLWRLEGQIRYSYGAGTITYNRLNCRWGSAAGDNTTTGPSSIESQSNVDAIWPSNVNGSYHTGGMPTNLDMQGYTSIPASGAVACAPVYVYVTSGSAKAHLSAYVKCSTCSDARLSFVGMAMKITD